MKSFIQALVFGAVVAFCIPHAVAKEKQEVSILAFDALAEKNKQVELHCKVERMNLLRSDIPHANVAVFVNDTLAGQAITDRQGVARVNYIPSTIGEHTIRFECAGGDDRDSAEASSILFRRNKSKPAIIVDIDQTISDIALETAGCEILSLAAAFAMLPASATAIRI